MCGSVHNAHFPEKSAPIGATFDANNKRKCYDRPVMRDEPMTRPEIEAVQAATIVLE
jgi:hypothetical protein